MSRSLFLLLLLVSFQSIRARAATAPGPDSFGYSVATTSAFSFTNITNGSRALYFADDTAITVNIGFNFNFYGSNYTTVSFNPNGLITFSATSTDFNNVNLTTTVAPSNNLPCIAVLWDDWETQTPGSDAVYYKTVGSVGSRQFIVQWNKVIPVNGAGTNPVTFEARLFEGSNQILLSYLDVVVSDDPSYGNGAFATVGIRDTDGQSNNRNLLWSHNQAVISNGENLLFARPNHAPIAVADSASTAEDTAVVINVLANDSDADGNILTITFVTQGTNGSVTINGGTNLTYHPNANFHGTDSFFYTISDGQVGLATNTVSISVTSVNDAPIAAADFFTTYANLPLTLNTSNLLANDVDADGDTLTVTSVSNPGFSGGTVHLTGTTITYAPPANFTGQDAFNYSVSDGHGGSASGLVTINVSPPLTIRITGSTAFRQATYKAITNLFDHSVSYGEVGYPATGSAATNQVFKGTIPGIEGQTIVKAAYAGSVGGISNLLRHALVSTFLKDAPGAFDDYEAPVEADFSMSDSAQASTFFGRPTNEILGFDTVGVVTFAFVKNMGSPSYLTNITASQVRSLLSFNIPLSLLTGVSTDSTTNVYCIGRDENSGTRIIAFAESGFGTTTTPQQWFINSSAVLSSAGAGGYSSGGDAANALKVAGTGNASDPQNPGHGYWAIGYLGSSDASSVNGGANNLLYNGTPLSNNNVMEGRYSFWSYEYLMYHSSLAGNLLTFKSLLLPKFNSPLDAANDSGLRLDQMNVGRNSDGGDVFHN